MKKKKNTAKRTTRIDEGTTSKKKNTAAVPQTKNAGIIDEGMMSQQPKMLNDSIGTMSKRKKNAATAPQKEMKKTASAAPQMEMKKNAAAAPQMEMMDEQTTTGMMSQPEMAEVYEADFNVENIEYVENALKEVPVRDNEVNEVLENVGEEDDEDEYVSEEDPNFDINDYESGDETCSDLDNSDYDEELAEVRLKKMEKANAKKSKTIKESEEERKKRIAAARLRVAEEIDNAMMNSNVEGGINNEGYDSENYDSDGYDSAVEDEEGQLTRRKSEFHVFDASTDLCRVFPSKGLKFRDVDDVKKCIRGYAIMAGKVIGFPRSNRAMVLALCHKGKCPWRLYASKMRGESTIQIKSLRERHTCGRNFKLRAINSRFLAELYHDKILSSPAWKLKEFVNEVCDKYLLDVTIVQCYRAKQIVLSEVEGSLVQHYSRLRDYGEALLQSNPGSTVRISSHYPNGEDKAVFQRMYICLDAIKRGWKAGCRPFLGLDGCFLKGFCKGELLTAVGRDGNNQMFPLAWAQVESENKSSWSWFIEILLEDLQMPNGEGLTIISDQQKGLVPALKELCPAAEVRKCARHVYHNFRNPAPGTDNKLAFWRCVKSSTEDEYKENLLKLKAATPIGYEYFKKQNPETFCKAFFSDISQCDSVENNMSETFNGVIVDARSKPIILMMESIRRYCAERIQKKRVLLQSWNGICPNIMKKIEKSKLEYNRWRSSYIGNDQFEVRCGLYGYIVNIKDKTCTCRLWSLSGIPCVHAITCIEQKVEPCDAYVSACYTVEKTTMTYEPFLCPVNGQNLWPKSSGNVLLPPCDRRMPGRPRVLRRRAAHEDPKKARISKVGSKVTCSNCKEVGHNKKTCKGPAISAPLKEKRSALKKKNIALESTENMVPKKRVAEGYGVHTDENTGDTCVRVPGQNKRTKGCTQESITARAAKGSTSVGGGQQKSMNTDYGPSCTQESITARAATAVPAKEKNVSRAASSVPASSRAASSVPAKEQSVARETTRTAAAFAGTRSKATVQKRTLGLTRRVATRLHPSE